MRPEMVFPVASITKQFTAAAILMLAEQGRLSLSDPITRFLPAYPAHGATITIEHLLTHTSGISSLTDLPDLRASSSQDVKAVDLMTEWIKDQPMDASPGAQYAYLNWGYTLLGAIVEEASGQSYAEFLQQRIFAPLGMDHTSYNDRARLVSLRAAGYAATAAEVFNVLPDRSRIAQPRAAGGLLSTVDDLVRWNDGLDSGRVLTRASRDRMFTAARLTDGRSTGYGYAWGIGAYDGHAVQEHAAGTPGFLGHVLRMPDDGVFVAILSNLYSFAVPAQATAHRVAAIAIGRPLPTPTPVPVAPSALDPFAGNYRVNAQTVYTVTREENGLALQLAGLPRWPLIPVGPLEFRSPNVTWRLTFERDAASRAARLRIRDWTLDDTGEMEPEAPQASPAVVAVDFRLLDAYAGEYELITGVNLTVSRAGAHLRVRATGQPPVDVWPSSNTEFFAREHGPRYAFRTDLTGRVTGLLVRQGSRNLPARRLD
jgi:CubicO group peptidase (beta-lactamase class C family)